MKYTGKHLYEYLDGDAEIYLRHGFKDLEVRTLEVSGIPVKAEIFNMLTRENALHIFREYSDTRSRSDIHYGDGVMTLVHGSFYICLSAHSKSKELLDRAAAEIKKSLGFSRIPRRKFMGRTAAAAAGLALCASGTASKPAAKKGRAKKSRVVLIRNQKVLRQGKLQSSIMNDMMERAMVKLTGKSSSKAAWKSLFSAGDTVGIKSNVWPNLFTPAEVEKIIKDSLAQVGVKPENMAVDDRGVVGNPVFQRANCFINVRPLRTHHWSGIGGCIKNPIMFSEEPYTYHDDHCADLAQVWKDSGIVGKVRLNILLMLTPLFHGIGPHHYHQKYTWPYAGIIVSRDPVAADAVGLRILEAKRKQYFGGEKPFKSAPHHVRYADERHGLGNSRAENIDLVMMGEKRGRLI